MTTLPDSDSPTKPTGSITRQALSRMSVRIAVVLVAASTLSYFFTVENLEREAFEQLAEYVRERGQRENAIFALAEDNHAILHDAILEELTSPKRSPAEIDAQFNQLLVQDPDGAIRNRADRFDGKTSAGVYVDDEVHITPELRHRIVTFRELCTQYGRAWHARFQDTYITTPENIMVIYWPEVPRWCQDATTDLNMPSEEYVWVADEAHDPERETVWTGLFYDHVAKVWMVSCETPVDHHGQHIATIGHDITLNELMDRIKQNRIEGTYNLIIGADGELIIHPELMEEIQQSGGRFDIGDSQNPRLASLANTVFAMEPGETVLRNPGYPEYLVATKIEQPGWFFVTVCPEALLTGQAMNTTWFVFGIGLATFALVISVLVSVLERDVAKPLRNFVAASIQVSRGEFSIQLDTTQNNELGSLAMSFQRMLHDIAERDRMLLGHATELASHGDLLEAQVQERTKALERTLVDLEQARIGAEASSRSKSDFLANMSHEIRTPMTAILGFADSLLAEDLDEAGRADAIQTIQRNGEHLLGILNDILDLSKIDAGKVDIETVGVSIHDLVDDVRRLMQVRADAKQLPLLIDVPPQLPELIESDPTRLRQILINLVGNAIKFTETGSVCIRARLVTEPAESRHPILELAVVDTGIGISSDDRARIFSEFDQADTTTTRRFGGTGLGLAISQRLAELLGGSIRVESEKGQGSSFILSFSGKVLGAKPTEPSAAPPADEAPPEAALPAPVRASPDRPANPEVTRLDCRILLAEDGLDNQKLLRRMLESVGAEVTIVDNGQLALDAIGEAETPFDLLLLDMQMPVLSGYETATTLREAGDTIPIVALTAHAMATDRQRCLDAGCDDFMTKPVRRTTLVETIAGNIPTSGSRGTG